MKGIFSQIRYEATGAVLRDAKMVGAVAGIPIKTEQKKTIMLGPGDTYVAGTYGSYPVITMLGDNEAFGHKDGDVLSSLSIWIRGGAELKADAVMVGGVTAGTHGAYGDGGQELLSFNPIIEKPVEAIIETVNIEGGVVTFNGDADAGVSVGDVISFTMQTTSEPPVKYGLIGEIIDVSEVNGSYSINAEWYSPLRSCDEETIIIVGDSGEISPAHAFENVTAGDTILGVVGVKEYSAVVLEITISKLFVNWDGETPPPESNFRVTAIKLPLYTDEVSALTIYHDYTMSYSAPLPTPKTYAMYFDSIVYPTSVHGVISINKIDDLVSLFGDNSLSNPLSNLAIGAFLQMAGNGFRDKIKICSLDLRDAIGLAGTSPDVIMSNTGLWAEAITKLDAHKDIYYLSTMTNDATIQGIWEQYVLASSAMERQREKMYYLPKVIINNGAIIYDLSAHFGNTRYGTTAYTPGQKYRDGINGVLTWDKDADVDLAETVPMPTNSERMVYIGHEWAEVGEINIEGYHLSALISGWRSSMPLGYVADGMKVPLLTGIPSSGNYYTEDDLSRLSKSGWYMLQQEADGSPVVCYMQKTSAYGSVEKGEESFIVALDSAMRDIRETLAPYIKGGLDNRVSGSNPDSPVTVRYLKKLNSAISMVRHKYIDVNEVFATMEIVSIKVHEMKKTASEIKVKFSHYYPNREIYVIGYVE